MTDLLDAAYTDMCEISTTLRHEREKQAIYTQEALGGLVGVLAEKIADWEEFYTVPRAHHLVAWAWPLGYRLVIEPVRRRGTVTAPPSHEGDDWRAAEIARLLGDLNDARVRADYEPDELAVALGVSRRTVFYWMAGRHAPGTVSLAHCARVLGCALRVAR